MATTRRFLALPMAALLFMSCTAAQLQNTDTFVTRHEGALRLAIGLGVNAFLKNHPSLAKTVYTVAHESQATLKDSIDLTQLRPSIRAAIALAIADQETRFSLYQVADAVETEVQQYLTDAKLSPSEIQVLVSKVFGWIADAANLRLGGKGAA